MTSQREKQPRRRHNVCVATYVLYSDDELRDMVAHWAKKAKADIDAMVGFHRECMRRERKAKTDAK